MDVLNLLERMLLKWSEIFLYALFFFYCAWVCRRQHLKKVRYGLVFFSVGLLLVAGLIYYSTLIVIVEKERLSLGIPYLFLGGIICSFLISLFFFIWATVLGERDAVKAELKLLPPKERKKFWIEIGLAFIFLLALFLRERLF